METFVIAAMTGIAGLVVGFCFGRDCSADACEKARNELEDACDERVISCEKRYAARIKELIDQRVAEVQRMADAAAETKADLIAQYEAAAKKLQLEQNEINAGLEDTIAALAGRLDQIKKLTSE